MAMQDVVGGIRRKIENELDCLLAHEERYWRQQSHEIWLKNGDTNTKYFHARASHRRARNMTRGIYTDMGGWVSGQEGICKVVENYFGDIYKSSQPCQEDIERVTCHVQPCLNTTMSVFWKFSTDEVQRAVFEMFPTKAPGPNGFPALFYQKIWPHVVAHVTKSCLSVLNDGHRVWCGSVKPSRGLRQGDPLSPYIFLICLEGLSRLIFAAERKRDIAGFRCSPFFADDSLLFSKALERDCLAIRRVIDCYALASRHVVNFQKSAMCVRKKVTDGQNRKTLFTNIKDRIWDRVKGWQSKLFSLGGKEVLIKAPNALEGSPFLWQSLCWGRELLAECTRWRIGNGKSMLIYKDKWILRPYTFRVISPPMLEEKAKVSELKLPSGAWNETLIRGVFLSADVDLILSIPFLFSSRRNMFLHNSGSLLLDDVLPWVTAYGKEYSRAIEPEVGRDGSNIHKIEKWIPPSSGGYKVNTDVVLDAQEGHIGVGIIIRNDVGDVMASGAQRVMGGYSVPIAEAIAILKGMQFACNSGLNPCIFESDAHEVVYIINSRVSPLSEIGLIISDIMRLLDGPFNFHVTFAPRSANRVAHGLAKLGLKIVNNLFFIEECPP
ncbi:hypothetical protein Ddye_027297 [Dipteronia dyeriana]|uniref:RNase H type-1 domain-containing protein n=1 Tax=Dipteronia dyeriana TaxID=168575 RepID=A0AAD9TNV0_9ROSI|nr:hypothetical protein Ddye_027297 [Dipteronia dyeriana]